MLDIVPVTLAEANAFVEQNHRHHGKTVGHKFSVAVADTETGEIVGVAIVGRPVSRHLDNGWTLEVFQSPPPRRGRQQNYPKSPLPTCPKHTKHLPTTHNPPA